MKKTIEDFIKDNCYHINTADGDTVNVIDVEDVREMMKAYTEQETSECISASRDMLEALMDIVKYHSDKPTGLMEGHTLGGTIPFNKANMAIRKALGK